MCGWGGLRIVQRPGMIGLKCDREGVWMKKHVFRILVCAAAFAFLLRTGGCLAKDGAGDPLKLAGNYV